MNASRNLIESAKDLDYVICLPSNTVSECNLEREKKKGSDLLCFIFCHWHKLTVIQYVELLPVLFLGPLFLQLLRRGDGCTVFSIFKRTPKRTPPSSFRTVRWRRRGASGGHDSSELLETFRVVVVQRLTV